LQDSGIGQPFPLIGDAGIGQKGAFFKGLGE